MFAEPNNCGSGGTVCSANHAAQSTCASPGVCNGACIGGFADCNGDKLADGCETSIASDPMNCGGCNKPCALAHATAGCGGGTCVVAACVNAVCRIACNPGFGNCDGDIANGCEGNVFADPNNCGSCGTVCSANHVAQRTCASPGLCNRAFIGGLADCNGDKLADGC